MSPTDTAELRRLWAKAEAVGGDARDLAIAMNTAYLSLPAMLDELEALREEARRLTQANGDLRKERDRAVAEAQRQDGVAKGLRAESKAASKALETVARIGEPHDQCEQERDAFLLAAQALEAWAWQWEKGASVRETTDGQFWCAVMVKGQPIINNYYADTPLGAVLAAMEGEKDGND